MNNNADLLADVPWCDKCHAHVVPMSAGELLLSWACYCLLMAWPARFVMSQPCRSFLPWAGNIAYRCTCWRNNFRAMEVSK